MNRHCFACETLETRRLLSATAPSAQVADGYLLIYGTEEADAIFVDSGVGLETDVRISTPAGEASYTFAPWSFGGIHIDAGGGDDLVSTNDVVAWLGGSILGGTGSDAIYITDPNVSQDFYLDGGSGDDTIDIYGGTVNGVIFRGGEGDDHVKLQGTTVWNYVSFQGDAGNDSLSILDYSTIYGFTYVDGGEGNDVLYTDDSGILGGLYFINVEEPLFA